jgi:hypothetical protein
VLDDMMSGYGGRLINEPNVPEKYRPALRKLNHSIGTGKDRTEFDGAVLGLRDVIDHASPAVHTWLAESRSKLFKGEARGRIENSLTVDGKVIEIPDDKHPREQGELLRSQLPRFIETMKIANEQLVRYSHQLDHMLGEHGGHGGALGKLAVMQNLLFLADGWLKLTDEELAHELSHIRGFFPTVSTYSELLLAIVEVGGSSIALTATLASGIAKLAGDAALSASAAEVASSVGHTWATWSRWLRSSTASLSCSTPRRPARRRSAPPSASHLASGGSPAAPPVRLPSSAAISSRRLPRTCTGRAHSASPPASCA